jgi:hypothetical protein
LNSYCVDTCVLLDYLVLRYLAEPGAQELWDVRVDPRRHRVVQDLKDPVLRRAFVSFLRRRPRLRTTAGVTVEIARHVRDDDGGQFNTPTFWRQAAGVYRELGLDEHLVLLGDHAAEQVPALGLVDESLVVLCKRERLGLLTADRRALRGRALGAGIDVLDVLELPQRFGGT